MQWLRRLISGEPGGDAAAKAGKAEPEPERVAPRTPLRAEPPGLLALRASLAAGQAEERASLAQLRALAGSPDERLALEAVSRASRHDAPGEGADEAVGGAVGGAVSEAVRAAAAEIFLQRGEPAEALVLLERAATPGGLMVRAEALAARGELAAACATLERVLARDIAAPGVRDRLERWRARLGDPIGALAPAPPDATLFTAARPRGPFRIAAEAGRGGAAVVYEAEDEALGRTVALKVYHRPAEQRAQIEREACLAVSVAGTGVVQVYDADLDEGWLALEWVGGGTLREALGRRDTALLVPARRWLVPLVEALARLHAAGWAHGDIKPGNVFFRTSGEPVLGDFGLARRPGEPWAGGTVGYLSPERLSRRTASLSDDVYALGRLIDDVVTATDERGPVLDLLARCLEESRPASAEELRSHPALSAPASPASPASPDT
jgi:eukaryotic-like serine/threonine-protein kinase